MRGCVRSSLCSRIECPAKSCSFSSCYCLCWETRWPPPHPARQVARRLGADKVFGTVGSPEKISLASEYGYDKLFIRSRFVEQTLQATGEQGVHAVLDPVGGDLRKLSHEVLRPFGQLVVLGNAGGQPDVLQSTHALWSHNQTVAGFQLGSYSDAFPARVGQRALEALNMLATEDICSTIYGIYPAEEANEALRVLETGATRGKLLLKMAE
ncbi:zinc-binding dehydrogenase [Brevibacillus migulae]|uniref:zinc-binding dehydrogenase n=1 Tax=Brevibacillus migulae TaxID=1644114 RepID=UPI00106E4EE7|nr:zinc-binding dehydrogenase [Brevibacillus migulae]